MEERRAVRTSWKLRSPRAVGLLKIFESGAGRNERLPTGRRPPRQPARQLSIPAKRPPRLEVFDATSATATGQFASMA